MKMVVYAESPTYVTSEQVEVVLRNVADSNGVELTTLKVMVVE